jgi:type I restriction enzyme S subunit
MAKAILDTPSSAVNSIEICTSNKNQTEIPIDDLYDGIKVLVRYIITKNKGRENMKKTTTKDWEIKTLEEVCEFISRGISPKYTESQGLVVVNQKCIRNHVVNLELTRLHDNNLKAVSSEKFIKNGDVLINSTGTGTLGRVAQVTEDIKATVDSHVTIVRPNTEIFDKRFFAWVLFSLEKEIEESGAGASGQTELSRDTVRNFIVSYPKDKKEQKRIVKILDEKFGVIEKLRNITKKQIADAKELFESRLDEVYSSPDYNFGNLGDSVNIKTGKLNSNAAVVGGDYPFFTCSRQASQIDSYSFDCDAVLLAGNNASADFNVKHYKGKFDAYQRTYVITVLNNAELDIRFVYNLLLHGLAKFKESAVGAGTKFLKIGMIQDFQLPLFTLKEQKQIVKELDELSVKTKELETIFHQKIADLEELKKSYLADAFAGKL